MVRDIKILHTADTHLGYRQYHSEVRRKDFFKAFELIVNDAIEMQADAVVHAGDLFDSRNPTLEDLLETINILASLKAATIPFFGIVGNHENKQNTQWLDLLEQMGLASRLGKKPKFLGNVAIYGVDSVPRSKIPLFDYSGFEAPEASENFRKLLVMHQIVQPFPYAEWNCEEILENLPFNIDAFLLGDYHKYEKFKVKDIWVTYPGSTERNSVSESEARSYNIITLSDDGLEISKRTIPTRNFLFIPVKVNGEEKPYEQIFSAINEHIEELPESVVFLELSGDSGAVLSFSEIEEYLLNKGTLVSHVNDNRKKEILSEELLKVTFSDPERAVSEELKRMNLNEGALIIDEIIRNPNILKSRVDEETESRLSNLIEVVNFKDPDFRIENHINSAKIENPGSDNESGYSEDLESTLNAESTVNKEPANKIEAFSESELNQKTESSPEKEQEDVKEFSEEKSVRSSNIIEKKPKREYRKGKGKSSVPRQYNLGDYL
jgi:DNA repair exonuclease SbcCD nuclease subunit